MYNIEDEDTHTIVLHESAFLALCGLAADSHDVNSEGIYAYSEVWAELRRVFPVDAFLSNVPYGNGEDGLPVSYNPEAGL